MGIVLGLPIGIIALLYFIFTAQRANFKIDIRFITFLLLGGFLIFKYLYK